MRLVLLPLLAACSEYNLAGDQVDTTRDEPDFDPALGDADVIDEEFVAEGATGVDIVFFGDTSGSMGEELAAMGARLTEFVARLDEVTTSWQLAAVTGPSGCAQNGVLTEDTPDFANLFATGLTTAPGEDLVDEWGLSNVATALTLSGEGQCNAGLLRPEAELHVVFLSDEDDNSPGWDAGNPDYWTAYTDAIVAAKGDAGRVWISAVAGDVPGGCTGAEPATGYYEATQAFDGAFLSICGDWSSQVDQLAEVQSRQDSFNLSHHPDPDTLLVEVDGEARTSGWSFDFGSNTVLFDVDAPRTGHPVRFVYRVMD